MAEKINYGGPAFPIPLQPGQGWQEMAPCDGMTLRQYAAIKLRVPNSGTDWLDAGGAVQLGHDIKLELTATAQIGFATFGDIEVPIYARQAGTSERYYK